MRRLGFPLLLSFVAAGALAVPAGVRAQSPEPDDDDKPVKRSLPPEPKPVDTKKLGPKGTIDGKSVPQPGKPLDPLNPAGKGAQRGGPGKGRVAKPVTPAEPPPSPPSDREDIEGGETPGMQGFNQCLKLAPGKRLKVTLKPESELNDLLQWVKSFTCKKFIVPQSIRSQKVTIISPTAVTAAEAYRLFLSALNSIGLTVVPSGGALEIVETSRSKEGAPVYDVDEPAPRDDSWITRLVRLQNVPAAEMGNVLTKLRSKDGDVSWYDPTGTLILTDSAQNVQRMLEIVHALDIAGSSEKVWIVKLRNTTATETAQKLSEIFQVVQPSGSKGGAPPAAGGAARKPPQQNLGGGSVVESPGEIVVSKIIADERSNSLIIVASDHAYARIYALIKRLDAAKQEAGEMGDGRVHVYPLSNANADDIAATLGGLTGAQVSAGGGGTSTRRGAQTRGAQTPPPQQPQGGSAVSGAVSLFEGDVRVSADKPTNSLVIISSVKDFLTLKGVIKRLDIPRRQVFIEAAILEVSLDRSRQLGMNFHGGGTVGTGSGNTLIFGGLSPQKTLLPANLLPDLAQGLAAGALGPEIPGASTFLGGNTGVSIPSFGVFLKLLATASDVNVLSTPHIMTTDNEEAEIKVGQNIPFQTSFFGGGGLGLPGGAGATGAGGVGGLLPQGTVQRQDVALQLKITPHVNESGMVRLDVDQEIQDIASMSFGNTGLPSTTKRTVKTTVVVKDQQPIVLGGLITDRMTSSVTKIPLLGDIPIIGYFFKQTDKKMQKANLLIFLTPYVVNDQSDLKRIFERKWQERRDFLDRYTAFQDRREPEADLDYRRKRGLLEEINRTAREVDEEQAILQKIRDSEQTDDQGPIEIPAGFRPTKTVPGAVPPASSAPPGTPPPGTPPPVPARVTPPQRVD